MAIANGKYVVTVPNCRPYMIDGIIVQYEI